MQPETPHRKTILAQAYEFTDSEMFFFHEDNVEIEDVVESTLEDWKLPPSIEDEEDRLGDRPLGIILEEARGTPGYRSSCAILLVLDYKPLYIDHSSLNLRRILHHLRVSHFY